MNTTVWTAWWWWACLFSLITKTPNERMFHGGKRARLNLNDRKYEACTHNQAY